MKATTPDLEVVWIAEVVACRPLITGTEEEEVELEVKLEVDEEEDEDDDDDDDEVVEDEDDEEDEVEVGFPEAAWKIPARSLKFASL